jgi:hypothetical protein
MYYVYILVRPNEQPFYVGKGKGRRVFEHETEARGGCPCHKCNVIRKIWRSGGEVKRYTVLTTTDEMEALAYEQTMIALLGRSTLTNKTDGGDGPGIFNAEIRARLNTLFRSPEWREQLRTRATRLWSNPSYRRRVSAAIKASHADPVFRRLMSETKQRHWADPDVKERYLADRQSPERREKSRITLERLNQDPAFREKGYATRRAPAARKRHGQTMAAIQKSKWADPEYRAKMAAIRREQGARLREANTARRSKPSQTDPAAG